MFGGTMPLWSWDEAYPNASSPNIDWRCTRSARCMSELVFQQISITHFVWRQSEERVFSMRHGVDRLSISDLLVVILLQADLILFPRFTMEEPQRDHDSDDYCGELRVIWQVLPLTEDDTQTD